MSIVLKSGNNDNQNFYGGTVYSSKEEAKLANIKRSAENQKRIRESDRDAYRQYQREYYHQCRKAKLKAQRDNANKIVGTIVTDKLIIEIVK
jgi:hypothetical protein